MLIETTELGSKLTPGTTLQLPSNGDCCTRGDTLLVDRLASRSADPCSGTPRATENAVLVKVSPVAAAATTCCATVPGSRYAAGLRGACPMATAMSSRL